MDDGCGKRWLESFDSTLNKCHSIIGSLKWNFDWPLVLFRLFIYYASLRKCLMCLEKYSQRKTASTQYVQRHILMSGWTISEIQSLSNGYSIDLSKYYLLLRWILIVSLINLGRIFHNFQQFHRNFLVGIKMCHVSYSRSHTAILWNTYNWLGHTLMCLQMMPSTIFFQLPTITYNFLVSTLFWFMIRHCSTWLLLGKFNWKKANTNTKRECEKFGVWL